LVGSREKDLTALMVKHKKILVLCPFPVGVAAGQRLKYEQYFEDWKLLGYEIDVSSFMDLPMWHEVYAPRTYTQKILGVLRGHLRRCRDILFIRNYDLIYVFMWITPFGTSFFERLVRHRAACMIYDIEDNLFTRDRITSRTTPNKWVTALKNPKKAMFLVRHADHVITSSPFLNDFCLSININKACTYVSSSVDTERFVPKTAYSNERTVVIGWTGTFSSKMYLDTLRGVFLRLSERVSYKLRIIGNFDYSIPGIDLQVIQWNLATEVEDLQGLDIGVYPLADDDWVLGKSGLKAIQYMAFGVPVVATNVGTTPLLVSHEVDGLLVTSQDEWVDALERLIREPDLRRKLGQAARKKAVERYSLKAIRDDYRNILGSVMSKRV
jgi:glycosyltransferase involved in cell wall biosynthesis